MTITRLKVKKEIMKTEAVKPLEGYVFDGLLKGTETTGQGPYTHTFTVEGKQPKHLNKKTRSLLEKLLDIKEEH